MANYLINVIGTIRTLEAELKGALEEKGGKKKKET